MTGSTLGGNKVRKLEFELGRALVEGATDVIVCGAVQSNYARAACCAAVECGVLPHAVLRSSNPGGGDSSAGDDGNMRFHRLLGTDIRLVPSLPFQTGLLPVMRALQSEIETASRRAHIFPVGGSGTDGLWGFIDAFDELRRQLPPGEVSDVFVAAGSGGSCAGLAIANALAGSPFRIHAVPVCDDAQYFLDHCQEMSDALGLSLRAREILSVVDGYKGEGYGKTNDRDLDLLVCTAECTGVVTDPVYTVKALRGAVEACAAGYRERQDHFHGLKGDTVVFWHTGGMHGAMGEQLGEAISAGRNPPKVKSHCVALPWKE
jgi:D-cysteine desulfhydrase